MSKNLKSVIKDLCFVNSIKCRKAQKEILNYLSKNPKYFKAFKEIANNIIKGNVKLNTSKKKRLAKHKSVIKGYQKKSLTKLRKRKLVVQSGGWLWIIPLISTIIDLVN